MPPWKVPRPTGKRRAEVCLRLPVPPRAQWTGIAPVEPVRPAGGGATTIHDNPAVTGEIAEGGEQEAEERRPGFGATAIQHQLAILQDNTLLRGLVAHLKNQGRLADTRRLQELRDPTTDHQWVKHLNQGTGPVIAESDFIIALQLRLGAMIVPDS